MKVTPDIKEVIDSTISALSPYEFAIYMFMFRHSYLKTGEGYIRISFTQIAKSIKSKYGDKRRSDRSVSANITTLTGLGLLRAEGTVTRNGTLYKVFLPQQTELEVENVEILDVAPKKEVDYYNIPENRLLVYERDSYSCYKCPPSNRLTVYSATLDHINPVSKGGDHSYDNLITCCFRHNSQRGNIPISTFTGL